MRVEEFGQKVRAELAKAVVGQEDAVDLALVALLANGHILLEGLPGLAKTLLVRSLALTLNFEFGRVQFTPDLMPSDVLGGNVFDPRTEERAVTIDGERHPLPEPFLVFATQNPIDFEGTYPLPEAQQDRFLFKVVMGYPEQADELAVMRRFHTGFRATRLEDAGLTPVIGPNDLAALRDQVNAVVIEDKIFDYIYSIVSATRGSRQVQVGASPRASLALVAASKAMAALRGRDFVIPDDVKTLAIPILRHRVLLRPEAEVEGIGVETVLRSLIDAQPVPR